MAGRGLTAETVLGGQAIAVAEVYVQALLGLLDNAQGEALAAELESLVALLESIDDAVEFLSPATSNAKHSAWIQRVFAGRCSQTLEGLLVVMARKGRLGVLPLVARRFRSGLDARQGRVEVTVVAARELDAPHRQALADTLREVTGAEPLLRTRVDPSLLGGVRVRVGDREYDGTLAGQMKRLRWRLRAAAARSEPASGEPSDHEAQS
jgi:F-type H+-transporting ATPase subunit delta